MMIDDKDKKVEQTSQCKDYSNKCQKTVSNDKSQSLFKEPSKIPPFGFLLQSFTVPNLFSSDSSTDSFQFKQKQQQHNGQFEMEEMEHTLIPLSEEVQIQPQQYNPTASPQYNYEVYKKSSPKKENNIKYKNKNKNQKIKNYVECYHLAREYEKSNPNIKRKGFKRKVSHPDTSSTISLQEPEEISIAEGEKSSKMPKSEIITQQVEFIEGNSPVSIRKKSVSSLSKLTYQKSK